jgi:sensor histidine kinase YesM
MNPHFIFNALAGIQNMIISQDAVKASIYLSRFSELVRNILNSSVFEFVALENEIRIIENYLELQKVRYPERFEYKMDIDPKLDTETLKIPSMIAQPFIENSIEHGFKNKGAIGHLEIGFKEINRKIHLEIKDDGIGRQKAKEQQSKEKSPHISLATDLTLQRIEVLNKKLKERIILNILDLEDQEHKSAGTNVIIEMPFIYR